MPRLPHSNVESRLANLRLLTDIQLGELELDELLLELLSRVQTILDADTAAVLLLDENSLELVARAARGLEEEVLQGVRVPIGIGFAGRIAATKGAIRLDRVDATTVSNPILWEKGIQVMLGVPLLAGDHVIGVLHVGRLDDRAFTEEDVDLLQVVAERVAGATLTRQLAVERAAAEILERSLLPEKLPTCDEVDFAARYVPAAGHMVGGDWYDAFTLPSGSLWVAIGDVAGHSLRAAVVMGRLKTALRCFALLELPPHDVLRLVDRKVELFEIDCTATVACAVVHPSFDTMTLAVAGHPPPVIAPPDREALFADAEVGPLLGISSNQPRFSTDVALEPGTAAVFYTDGLIERRHESLDEGLERLRAAVRPDRASVVAHTVMRALIGNDEPEDDVALLALHTNSAN